MRIALVTTYPPSTGSLNEYAYHFVRWLRQKEEVTEVILLTDDRVASQACESEKGQESSHAPVRIVPCWRLGAWSNPLRIAAAVRQTRPDIVLFNLQFATFGSGKVAATLGLLTPALVKVLGYPSTILLHNIMEKVDLKNAGFADNSLLERVLRWGGTVVTRLLLTADFVALTIPKYVEILEQKYRTKNVILAPHGAFEDAALVTQIPSTERPQVMAFGKFGTYKRVELLIEAFRLLKADGHPSLELVIAGTDSPNAPGYLESVRQQHADIPDVRFTGYVAEADVPRIFGEAMVVAFPYTSTTGSSGVLHQAGNYGKAVVLPNLGDFVDLVTEEGYTGEIFEPESPQSLADAIARVLDNPTRRYELELQNNLAACSLPMAEVVDWYVVHFQRVLDMRQPR